MDHSLRIILRAVRNFVFNAAIAAIGSNVIENQLTSVIYPKTWQGMYLSAGIAFLLGWFVYLKWRHRAALWVWSLGIVAFVWRPGLNSMYSVADAVESATLGFIATRAVFYSLGALACQWTRDD